MILNRRQINILKLLLKKKDYVTIKDLSQYTDVSIRTIYSDMVNIEEYLLHENYKLVKNSTKGITLVKDIKDNIKLIEKPKIDLYSIMGRREQILISLLLKNETVTYDILSNKYLVSKTSILEDLKFIKNLLKDVKNLEIISDKKGTRIVGQEESIQEGINLFVTFFIEEKFKFYEDDYLRIELLKYYFDNDIVIVVQEAVYEHLKSNKQNIADYYVFNILLNIIILTQRSRNNMHIKENLNNEKIEEKFKKSTNFIIRKIESKLKVIFLYGDKDFLYKILVSNSFELINPIEDYNGLVKEIIREVSYIIGLDLNGDIILFNNLLKHIPSMVYRMENNIKLSNPLIGQIKSEFSLLYFLIELILNQNRIFESECFGENEIGYITLHFQGAIERRKKSKSILIVCPNGLALSEVLYNRVLNVLPNFNTLDIASIKEVDNNKIKKYDLILSTSKLNIESSKIIYVTPLLDSEDIKNILEFYKDNINKSFIDFNMHNEIKKVIKKDFIFINKKEKSKKEILKKAIQKLEENKYVKKEFLQDVLNRETKGSTYLKNGVAIPHGSIEYVNKTMLTIIILKNPIIWDDVKKDEVSIIFLLSINKSDKKKTKDIINNVYSLLDRKDILKKIINSNKKEDIYNILKEVNCL